MKKILTISLFAIFSNSVFAVPDPIPMDPLDLSKKGVGDTMLNDGYQKKYRVPSFGKVGPVDFKVECENKNCSSSTITMKYGNATWEAKGQECRLSPCSVDSVSWFQNSRLIAVPLKHNKLHLYKAVYEKEMKLQSQDVTQNYKFERFGPLVDLGTNFVEIDDQNLTVFVAPSNTGLPFNEAFQIKESGLLIPDRERTCRGMEPWTSNERDRLDRISSGVSPSPKKKPKEANEYSSERLFLEISEYCKTPVGKEVKKEAMKNIKNIPYHVYEVKNFWNPVGR